MLLESDDRVNHAITEWFAAHRGTWCGTATELIAALQAMPDTACDLYLQPAGALYAYLQSHRQVLRSLGVDVLLPAGFPRMVSLRPCQIGEPAKGVPSDASASEDFSDQPNPSLPDSGDAPGRMVDDKHDEGRRSGGPVFENSADVLFGIVQMQNGIREQGLDLKSAMTWVAARTQELTGSSGVALGLLQQDAVLFPARVGIAVTMAGVPSQAKLFQSCIHNGDVLPLPDAQSDTVVGSSCRREGVKSLIVIPICCDQEIAGAIEIFFKETRCFSNSDVMTLELIADVVSQQMADASQNDARQTKAQKFTDRPRISENLEPPGDKAALEESGPHIWQNANPATASGSPDLESSSPGSISAAGSASDPWWFAWKRAWMKYKRP